MQSVGGITIKIVQCLYCCLHNFWACFGEEVIVFRMSLHACSRGVSSIYNAGILEVIYGNSNGSESISTKCLWSLTKCKVCWCRKTVRVKEYLTILFRDWVPHESSVSDCTKIFNYYLTGILNVVLFPFLFIIAWMNKKLIRSISLLEQSPCFSWLHAEINFYLTLFLSVFVLSQQCMIYANISHSLIRSFTAAAVKQN